MDWHKFVFGDECKKYGIKTWECPSILFLLMGFTTISALLFTVYMKDRLFTSELMAPVAFGVAIIIFAPGSIIVQSFERMASANRLKSEFVSIVSHQLRSPLSSIKWSVSLLIGGRLGELSKKHKNYLNIIENSNERMLLLVGDLLNVSRIDQGELLLVKEEVDIKELIKNVVSTMQVVAKENRVTLVLQIPKKRFPKILADPVYLTMVINNFVDNAIRYSNDNGKVEARLSFDDSSIKFEVEDNGVGISENEKKHIFEKFFRAYNSLRYKEEGTGLGLYISKSVIEQMHGKIGFNSKEGTGTTFWFVIPLK